MARVFWLCFVFTVLSCSYLKKKTLKAYLSRFQDKKAERVYLKQLPSSYQKQAHPHLDALWWNEDLKSSISYFSSCSKRPKNLQEFQISTYPPQYKRIQFSKKSGALYSVLEVPQLNNKKTYMAVYTVQKKNCYFNLNLVAGSLSFFKSEEPLFKEFIKSLSYK